MLPVSLKLKAQRSKQEKLLHPILEKGAFNKTPKGKLYSGTNSLIEEIQNTKMDKRSRVTKRPSLFSVNTDLIYEGSMSEMEVTMQKDPKTQKESLFTIGSIKNTEDDPHLIK